MSMFKQHPLREEIKGNSMRKKKLSKAFLIHPYMSLSLHSRYLFRKMIWKSTQVISKVTKGKRLRYHSLPISYVQLLPMLVQSYKISVMLAKPRRPPYPKWYNPNARCHYHSEVEGHSTEDCMAFKDRVQALIDADRAKFKKLISSYRECQD